MCTFLLLLFGAACTADPASQDGEPAATAEASRPIDPPPPEEATATFQLTPANPQPGESFTASFNPSNSRGGYFTLQLWNGNAWETALFLLESDVNGGQSHVERIQEGTGVDDYGIEGPGPDGLLMPADLDQGHWRLCTENALDHVCAQVLVSQAVTWASISAPFLASGSGFDCSSSLFEAAEFDTAALTLEEAIDDYWTSGDGRYRDDRNALVESIDSPTVSYTDQQGNSHLILTFEEINGRWPLAHIGACSYISP